MITKKQCRFKYSVEMLRKDKAGKDVWIKENRFYFIKVDLLPDNEKRRNFTFIEELENGIES